MVQAVLMTCGAFLINYLSLMTYLLGPLGVSTDFQIDLSSKLCDWFGLISLWWWTGRNAELELLLLFKPCLGDPVAENTT